MAAQNTEWVSNCGWSTRDQVVAYGSDLVNDLLGRIDFGGMFFLGISGREPTSAESRVFNALLVTLVEHGQTPSTIAARLTYLGAPEALQAAVSAGLAGLGTVFVGSIEGAAKLVQDLVSAQPQGVTDEVVRGAVASIRTAGRAVPGIGHPVHKPVDPRAVRLFEIAREESLYGPHCAVMERIAALASELYQRNLSVNATGAIGAIASELRLPWGITRGLGVVARSAGIVAHLREEMERPFARDLWMRVDEEVGGAPAN